MLKKMSFKKNVAITASLVVCPFVNLMPVKLHAQETVIEEIIVTAQRKEESIQDVPIAVSAFSNAEMEERLIDSATDLQLFVPNLSYRGGNAFQIRGVGSAVGGATGDVGVGVHHNNAPQVLSRIATAEAFDMERIEVLRGPQGTLYGRNSTGGVINFITAKPRYEELQFSGEIEAGNYNAKKIKAMVNVPISDNYALRFAGVSLSRDGFTDNIATGNDIDDRDLWSGRVTFGFEPSDNIRGWVLYEKFEEDDSRSAGQRTRCVSDPGPDQIGSTAVTNPVVRALISEGCQSSTSVYDRSANDNPHSVGTFGGRVILLTPGFTGANLDFNAGQSLPNDLRKTSAYADPSTEIEHEIAEFEVQFDISETLTFSLLGHHSEDNSRVNNPGYGSGIDFANGNVIDDPQIGLASNLRQISITDTDDEQTSLELRLFSAFDGPVNFNLGFLKYNVERNGNLLVTTNGTYLASVPPGGLFTAGGTADIFIDTNSNPTFLGHNYFVTSTPYELDSQAIFGELYYDMTDTVQLTAGLRYTDDDKERVRLPIIFGSEEGANGPGTAGYPADQVVTDQVDFQEWTGRLVLDWLPDLSFSDSTLIYGSLSRGYKSGGFNSPETAGVNTFQPYLPEFVNALEFGTKNVFSGGRAQVNATLFFYDYQDYQISKIETFSVRNENVDAEVLGFELETVFEPADNLFLTLNAGWMDAEITDGESIDPLDRTGGDSNFTALRGLFGGCVLPTATAEAQLQGVQAAAMVNPAAAFAYLEPCTGLPAGIPKDISGNTLPGTPELSYSVALEYSLDIANWWTTFRVDYSWQDEAYVSYFNDDNYYLEAWDNANVSLNFVNDELGVTVQLFGKNLADEDTVISYGAGGEGVGKTRAVTLLDPRLYGINMRYEF